MPLLPENVVALGRIGGPLLDRNLKRKNAGSGEENLSFGNTSLVNPNVLYLDIINGRVGINTDVPSHDFLVNSEIRTTNLRVPTQTEIANFVVTNNTIQNISSSITLSPDQTTDPIIDMVKIGTYDYGSSIAYLNISNRLIENIRNNSDIELSPDGTGEVNITTSELYVDGDFTATGNITWDGTLITLGSDDTDNVVFNADVNSDIIPNINETYDLGTALKRWDTVYTKNLPVTNLILNSATINGINILLDPGNTFYVSIYGNDSNFGTHLHNTFRTVKYALSRASAGDTIIIFPGVYEEEFPLTVPAGVTVNGAGIRAVTITPTEATKNNDSFLLNGETTVSHLTVKEFFYDSANNTGYGFRFADNFTVTSRSPYVQNVSVITQEGTGSSLQITVGPAPTLFSFTSNSVSFAKEFYSQALVDSLVGQIAVIDRYPNPPLFYTVVSIEDEPISPTTLWRMTVDTTFNATGQLKPISFYPDVGITQIVTNDIWDTTGNSIGEKWVAWYKYNLPSFFTTLVQPGWTINVAGTIYIVDYIIEDPVNTNMWRIYVTTSLVAGVGIPIFSSPLGNPTPSGRGALVDGSAATSTSKEASMLFHSVTMITPNSVAIEATNGARVEWLNSFTYFADKGIYLTQGTEGFAGLGLKFGAEMRSIGSACVYGNYGAVADGANTIGYLINHNFAYIGLGTDYSNDPGLVIQANEVLEQNNGKIYHESTDHKGDFRVGDIFYVNQETGAVVFNAQSISFLPTGNITLTGPTSSAFIDATTVDVGNIRVHDNTVESVIGPLNFLAFSGTTNLNTNVFVTGDTNISADVIVRGNLYLGNQSADTITIYPNFTQDLLPDDVGGPFTLGTDPKRWNTLYGSLLNVDGVTRIDNNTIETLTTNTNLEFLAAGTGKVIVANTDVEITNNLTIAGDFTGDAAASLKNLELTNLTLTGNLTQQTGDTYIIGTFANNNIEITGSSYFEVPNVKIFNNEISITATDTDLNFTANGTGGVILENLKIVNNTVSNVFLSPVSNAQRSIYIQPNGTGNVVIDSIRSLQLPAGNISNRVLSTNGEIRYNTTDNIFEGFQQTNRISFSDVSDVDRNTTVQAGASDNTLYFTTNGTQKARINTTALITDTYFIDNISLNSNTINNRISGNNLQLLPTGTGNIVANGIGFSADSKITNLTNDALVLKPTGTGYFNFAIGASAIAFPLGVSAERRATPEVGETRFNTEKQYLEVYTGNPSQGESGWVSAIGAESGIVDANVVEGFLDIWTLVLG